MRRIILMPVTRNIISPGGLDLNMVRNFASRVCYWIGAVLLLLSAHNLLAQPADSHAKDEADIRQAGKEYLAAINRNDTKAVADFWTANGTYTDDTGRTVKVQELLSTGTNQNNVTGARANGVNVKVRFVSKDVAIENGEFDPPAVDGAAPVKCHYSALWVREGSRWKLDDLRETQIEWISNADQLASLNLFTGEWSGEANKIAIHVSAGWDANKKFLHRMVTMTSGKASMIGRQEIGWDPLSQQIRSWMFGDDGSYSEGLWNMEGNVWMVLATRALPDGRISKATQIYKFPDKNTVIWKVIEGSIDGQPTDDFEVVLKRSEAK